MPQILDANTGHPHHLCPVKSFKNYINHLHPDCISFWQQPLSKILAVSNTWYKPLPLDHNTFEKFMSNISEKCSLSQQYTNHCIRVTRVSNLSRQNYSAKQIMSVAGHKSIQSLAIYLKEFG